MTFPGFWSVEVAGEPPGKTHEYWAALEAVPKETDPPATIVAFPAGDEIVPRGGEVA